MSNIPLIAIPRVLKLKYGWTPSYEQVWKSAINARIPAVQAENGRWQADPADVAELFEMK